MSEVIADRYRLVAALGEGGMGRVWRARDELLGRDVALKELVLPRGLAEAEIRELRERAMREARAIARIDHPDVVRVFDVFHDGGSPWIVMELVVGGSLFEEIRDDGPMAPERAARIGLAVLAALRAAHRAGVLHRDVKPANVLLGDDGRVVLSDFGLAAASGESGMTSASVVLGSPSYLAPERALDDEITAAADLWSLGATLYAAVEGRPPYDKSSPVATLAALATQPPRPATRAGVLAPVLRGLLRKDPAERIGPDEAESLLRAAAAGELREGPAPEIPEPALAERESAGRGRSVVWWAGIAAVLLLVAVIAGRPAFDTGARAGEVPGASAPAQRPSAGATERPSSAAAAAPVPLKSGRVTLGATDAPTVKATAAKPAAGPKRTSAPPPVAAGRPVRNVQTGTCLQLDGGGAIVMWACNGGDVQKFDVRADGSLRVQGRCVRVLGGNDGSLVGSGDCDGSAAARWDLNNSLDLVSLAAIKCLDVPAGNGGDGVPVQIWACNGTDNQKWRH